MLPPGYRWDPIDRVDGALWLVRERGLLVVASVFPRLDHGWVARIDRYRWRDRSAIAPSRRAAIRWVEQWVRARADALATVEREPSPGRAGSGNSDRT